MNIFKSPYFIVGLLFIGIGLIRTPPQGNEAFRRERIAQQQSLLELSAGQENQQSAREIANQRFQQGCLLVTGQDPAIATTLTEGEPVYDRTRKVPIGDGAWVCSTDGMTGVIENGVVGQLAWTGDREVVDAAIARFNLQQQPPQQ